MAFLPPVVDCLVEKGLQKGDVTGTPGPHLATPLVDTYFTIKFLLLVVSCSY